MHAGEAPACAGFEPDAWRILSGIPDPEIPVISIVELGIVRGVEQGPRGVRVAITPTYSGCPAMDAIAEDIRAAFAREGVDAEVERVLSPPWTTDGIAPEGREKLRAYGIAPPAAGGTVLPAARGGGSATSTIDVSRLAPRPACPRCASTRTARLAQFGSTACKALYRCEDCGEPFDHFKALR